MVTTIQVDEKVKTQLDKLKVHHRETYNELLEKLIDTYKLHDTDKESLKETIEILSDPGMMREIAEALEDFEKGKGKTIEQLKRELSIDV